MYESEPFDTNSELSNVDVGSHPSQVQPLTPVYAYATWPYGACS